MNHFGTLNVTYVRVYIPSDKGSVFSTNTFITVFTLILNFYVKSRESIFNAKGFDNLSDDKKLT